jgi:aspartyl-tRNA(Asn)/glutamyl-tRNA(Gln) amidotransferase subunit B
MKHTVLVGMEVHLQLRTRSKMFCRCPVRFGAPANTLVCPVCLGMPGSLPVPNREAITMALALATAMDCRITPLTKFDRKNYYYPDLPKGYQISQYDLPLATGGGVEVVTETGTKTIRLRRLHIEEDVGKNLHDDARGISRVDFNRAGTPLVEIVSEPDIASPEEARAYLNALRALVQYLDVSDANMQEGNLRCEPNVNLHIEDRGVLVKTPIIEVKNLNSVRNVERALKFEIERQLAEYRELGAAVAGKPRATRGFDDQRDQTFVMREKEEAHDYRYFPEPDIPPLALDDRWRTEARSRVPELPNARRRRFASGFGLSEYDADALTRERTTADYFEKAVAAGASPKPAANWIVSDLAKHANDAKTTVAELGLDAARLAALVRLVEDGKVSRQAAAKDLLPRLLEGDADPEALVQELGLARIDDTKEIEAIARKAIEQNPKAAADVRAGKEKAIGALMGFVMRETKGKANSDVVRDVLKRLLEEGA